MVLFFEAQSCTQRFFFRINRSNGRNRVAPTSYTRTRGIVIAHGVGVQVYAYMVLLRSDRATQSVMVNIHVTTAGGVKTTHSRGHENFLRKNRKYLFRDRISIPHICARPLRTPTHPCPLVAGISRSYANNATPRVRAHCGVGIYTHIVRH